MWSVCHLKTNLYKQFLQVVYNKATMTSLNKWFELFVVYYWKIIPVPMIFIGISGDKNNPKSFGSNWPEHAQS